MNVARLYLLTLLIVSLLDVFLNLRGLMIYTIPLALISLVNLNFSTQKLRVSQ